MTEEEWRTATTPDPMLELVNTAASNRKLQLFAVACCRRVWNMLPDDRYRTAIETVEKFADGLVSAGSVSDARGEVLEPPDDDNPSVMPVFTLTSAHTEYCRPYMARVADYARYAQAWDGQTVDKPRRLREEAFQSELLRDIFGNPFRPVTLDPRWRTETVVALANAIYAERAFDRMPILADALEDAGCDHADILAHCRGDGPHVRGCWVIDKILGKE